MNRRTVPSIVVAALVVLVVVLTSVVDVDAATARRGKVTKHHRHEHFRDHVVDLLPDIKDHGVMRLLRCSSCRELSTQLYESLLALYRAKDPSHMELVDVIDNMCLHHVNMYGLVKDVANESATTTFSRDSSVERVQGLWINQFVKDRCSHMMVHHEDAIIAKHPEADSLDHFLSMMCVEWDKSCDAVGTPNNSNPAPRGATAAQPKAPKPLSKGTFSRSMRMDEM